MRTCACPLPAQMYPQNWGTKEQDTAWFLTNWIQDRAAVTHQVAGKPIVLEETGVESDWADRDQVLIRKPLHTHTPPAAKPAAPGWPHPVCRCRFHR